MCACGHESTPVPPSREAALASHNPAHGELLEMIEADGSTWIAVLRCRACERYWAEDHISSGHAELPFRYPIETDDPHAWLAAATNLY
jgi:hypothetical protein